MPRKFDEFKAEILSNPEAKKAYEAASASYARSISRPCACGREGCFEWYDPIEDEIIGGWGPVGCPID